MIPPVGPGYPGDRGRHSSSEKCDLVHKSNHPFHGTSSAHTVAENDKWRFSMTMTVRESFERGTEAFNAHDIVGFAEVLADDAVFEAPGGMRGEGKAAC